jgi:hypothetical protein
LKLLPRLFDCICQHVTLSSVPCTPPLSSTIGTVSPTLSTTDTNQQHASAAGGAALTVLAFCLHHPVTRSLVRPSSFSG